jgi:hypothetical protein
MFDRDYWSPRFSTLWDQTGWVRTKTVTNVNFLNRNRFSCDLSECGTEQESEWTAIATEMLMEFGYIADVGTAGHTILY